MGRGSLWISLILALSISLTSGQVAWDPNEPLVDPETGKPLPLSRPTAFGKYLNTKFLNVAAKHNGGKCKAGYSQDGFDIAKAIDGVTTGTEGWAFHGRLDKAIAMFEFKKEHRVSRIRVLSGIGRFVDHHVTAFQIWYTNATGYMLPPSVHWFPHYHWHPIMDMQPTSMDTVVVGNRIYTNGEEEIVLKFSPIVARAVLLKIDSADSPANNAVLTEFEVFTADPDEVSAPIPLALPEFVDHSWVAPPPRSVAWKAQAATPLLEGGEAPAADALMVPTADTDVVPYWVWTERTGQLGNKSRVHLPLTFLEGARDLGWDPASEMRKLCHGRWFTPLHATVPFMQPHLQKSKMARYCTQGCGNANLAIEGQTWHVKPNETCAALAGTEFLFVGDTRMRHHFMATLAYLKGVNLRGYANPSHPHFYGRANKEHWYPPGREESCGSAMPHGFELECAGVTNGVARVCNDTVTLRLEETDDRAKSLARLRHRMETRAACEAEGSCKAERMVVTVGLPIPHVRTFSTADPARPAVPLLNVTDHLHSVVSEVDKAWQAARQRGAWLYRGGAAAARTALVWSLMEPYSFNEPRHAPYNRNISHINAECRQELDTAGIPSLDGFRIAVDRFDCHPDNVHWCSAVQNTKAGILLTWARQAHHPPHPFATHPRTPPPVPGR